MKVNVGLVTLVIYGLLSTGAAMARHHSHHAHGVKAGQSYAAHPASNTAGNNDRRGTGPHSAPADHPTATKDSSPKSGVGDAKGDEAKGLHDRKASTNDNAIDTRITVHQGHDKAKSVRERLFGKPKSGLAIIAARTSQHAGQSKTTLHRNAIGAVVTDDKRTKHDKAAIVPASSAASVDKPAADAPPATTAKVDPNAKTATVAAVPPAAPSPAPPPAGGHNAATAAIVVVSKSGQSINGTGMSRPGSGTVVLGGSPKIVAGVISGNTVHLKRP
jgi:hypothetical protein